MFHLILILFGTYFPELPLFHVILEEKQCAKHPFNVLLLFYFCYVGAKQPSYLVTADDVDAYLAIEVQPLDEKKRKVTHKISFSIHPILINRHYWCLQLHRLMFFLVTLG
jgi:hypothetical protein